MVWQHPLLAFGAKHSTQVPLFQYGPNGKPRNKKNILGRRNYCIVYYEEDSMSLVFDIRVEKEQGVGTTVRYVNNLVSSNSAHEQYCPSYPISAPPPMWHQ